MPVRRVVVVVTLALAVTAAVVAYVVLRPTIAPASTRSLPTASTSSTGTVTTPLPFRPATVTVSGDSWLSWALMDRRTGEIWGSATMDETSWTASMIKAWLAADYLRRAGDEMTPQLRHTVEIMIRDSDNDAADQVYALDGGPESIQRLISICGLTDSAANPAGWAVTNLSARDSVRMGTCIAGGTVAGPRWTPYLLDLMRGVRGEGDFGIRTALPPGQAGTVAIKNGYEDFVGDGLYHVNCLAIGDTWTLAVMQRYEPRSSWDPDLARGAQGCADVAAQLLAPA